jgi:hypothetical protein
MSRAIQRKWLLVAVVLAGLLMLSPGWLRNSAWLAAAVINTAIPLLVAWALAWFAYHLCLRPRMKLRRLHRIRVRQGRRHPLA